MVLIEVKKVRAPQKQAQEDQIILEKAVSELSDVRMTLVLYMLDKFKYPDTNRIRSYPDLKSLT